MKKVVYRVGDKVKIINPDIFLRCGYPLTKEIAIKTLIREDGAEKIKELLRFFDIKMDHPNLYNTKAKVYKDIEDAVAYALVANHSFGGSERKVYTQRRDELKYKIGTIRSKKTVRSGIYNHRSSGYSYWGEYDCEPAYLSGGKTHIILELDILDEKTIKTTYDYLRIEETNVEKVIY